MQEVGCPTLQSMGDQLLHFEGRELQSVLSTALRHLAFVNTPAMREFLSSSSVNPRTLVDPQSTSFFAVPPDKLQSLAPLTRAFFGCVTRLIAQSGLKDRRIQVVLDEAASLGRVDSIENGIAQLRGSGARYTFAFQAEKQVEKCFPEQSEAFMANMSLKVYFGVNDYATAKIVSDTAGDFTAQSNSTNSGWSSGGSRGGDGTMSSNWGDSGGRSSNEVARKLFTPDEVLALPHRTAIVFTQDTRPILTRLVHAYDPEFRDRKQFSAITLTLKAVLLAALAVACTQPAIVAIHQFAKGGPEDVRGEK
jgi:type IV secretion system protein VirD4